MVIYQILKDIVPEFPDSVGGADNSNAAGIEKRLKRYF